MVDGGDVLVALRQGIFQYRQLGFFHIAKLRRLDKSAYDEALEEAVEG